MEEFNFKTSYELKGIINSGRLKLQFETEKIELI